MTRKDVISFNKLFILKGKIKNNIYNNKDLCNINFQATPIRTDEKNTASKFSHNKYGIRKKIVNETLVLLDYYS